jgi:hypothetical protein
VFPLPLASHNRVVPTVASTPFNLCANVLWTGGHRAESWGASPTFLRRTAPRGSRLCVFVPWRCTSEEVDGVAHRPPTVAGQKQQSARHVIIDFIPHNRANLPHVLTCIVICHRSSSKAQPRCMLMARPTTALITGYDLPHPPHHTSNPHPTLLLTTSTTSTTSSVCAAFKRGGSSSPIVRHAIHPQMALGPAGLSIM